MFHIPAVTGRTQNILLASCHRVDPKHFTSLLSQGVSELLYFSSVTGWIRNVLLPLSRDMITGWTLNVLLPSCQRMNLERFTSLCHRVDP